MVYLYEFLWRGYADGTGAYHVVLAESVKDNFGGPDKTFTSTALTPEQAAKLGYDLPGIIKAINTGLMTENATLREHNAELENMLGALNNATDQTSPGWFSRVFSMFRS